MVLLNFTYFLRPLVSTSHKALITNTYLVLIFDTHHYQHRVEQKFSSMSMTYGDLNVDLLQGTTWKKIIT